MSHLFPRTGLGSVGCKAPAASAGACRTRGRVNVHAIRGVPAADGTPPGGACVAAAAAAGLAACRGVQAVAGVQDLERGCLCVCQGKQPPGGEACRQRCASSGARALQVTEWGQPRRAGTGPWATHYALPRGLWLLLRRPFHGTGSGDKALQISRGHGQEMTRHKCGPAAWRDSAS